MPIERKSIIYLSGEENSILTGRNLQQAIGIDAWGKCKEEDGEPTKNKMQQ